MVHRLRTRTIGVLLDEATDPFSAALRRAIEDECRARGFEVRIGGAADGVITDRPDAGGAAAVFVGRPGDGDTVVSTNVAGAGGAIRHLVSYGHHRIAYLGSQPTLTTERDRHRGYLRAIGRRAGPVVQDLHDEAGAERATIGVLRGADPPTAIFAATSVIAIGAVRALQKLRKQSSVALVGFDDFPVADLLEPAVTVVAQDPARMGRTAVGALFERLDGYDGPPREIRIPTTLIPRGSGEIS
ncbi:substrate-binding domain-containing protein [Paractinoplanes durhamensis]|uniref:LacI family transcriptional regulator n=1 Tax=Paractinoplanes durhamensis TaxID=113563 RepID=A0ABQ3ZBM7_9ACTN|nr:substrate-binding domain-containing protein [Actinoplanes durhamensis]GIE07239.1 LacI family transcriptional regulator [Actinoplanes durhamensis]